MSSPFILPHCLIRAANKPQFANAIWNVFGIKYATFEGECLYVLDGGALLQRIPWPTGVCYEDIFGLYLKYIKYLSNIPKYGFGTTTVVSDGCKAMPSTNDNARLRCNKGQIGKTINVSFDMTMAMKNRICFEQTQETNSDS